MLYVHMEILIPYLNELDINRRFTIEHLTEIIGISNGIMVVIINHYVALH